MAPPRKEAETKVKLTPEQGAAAILQYLRKENRPYSATDISSNLHNTVTKTAAAKLLKDMHERQEIEGRASGKQIVYHVIQVPAIACTCSHQPLTHTPGRSSRRLPREAR
jgi:26S proteasome regulatory subunit (ATPase 3-interacting protein)